MQKTWNPGIPDELEQMANEAGAIADIKEAEVAQGHNKDIYVHMFMSFVSAVGSVYPWIMGERTLAVFLMVAVLFHVSYWVSRITRGPVLADAGRCAEVERLLSTRAKALRVTCGELETQERLGSGLSPDIVRGRRFVAIRFSELEAIQDLRRIRAGFRIKEHGR